MPFDDRAIAISATFTAEAMQPALAFWAGELGLDYEIRFAGYNTLFQQLLDPGGLFASNRGGINVALARFEDWLSAGIGDQVRRFGEAVRTAAAAFPAPLIVAVCPPSPGRDADFEARLAGLREAISELTGVHLITPRDVQALYPVEEIHDPHGEQLGHLPYTPVYFVALATAIARRIHAIVTPPYKVAALDCDETLWAGICGEDGPHGVVLDPARRALQEFMAERRASGLLLALCSKNNEEDVVETFRAHPEMPLRLEDFAARRINWESKGAGLASLAAELDLGLDSFILVDDNPKECTEAQAGAPEALALALPAPAEEIPEFLRHVWAFDRAGVTEDDQRRPEVYAQRAERARAARAAASLEEFLDTLELEIRIAPLKAADLARVAQLTQRTNQMNATLARRTEPEIQILLAGGAECLTVDVRDRFGSYGLTGVIIFKLEDGAGRKNALRVDTFLLSCRALGRGVEHRMVARLGEIALERGLATVEIPLVAGQRNRPAALFLESLCTPEAGGVFCLSAGDAAAIKYRPGWQAEASAPQRPAEAPASQRRIDYARIANQLRDPAAILERIRATTRRAVRAGASEDPPRTPIERDLAELWAALLNLPSVGVRDNFFDLGGHSLLAVQLISRVRQIHGVDLSLEVVYSGDFTVAELASAIELKEIEQAGGDYRDLLRELDGLSDEEARSLLAEERDAS
ncbi:MAG: HAD-IIIC family phosphatase [Bryobacteraceae bacterium]|jgi:FkbH-like protein